MFNQGDRERFDQKLNNLDDETASFLRYMILCLEEWEKESLPRIIAKTIPLAPLKGIVSGAQGSGYMTHDEKTSLQSDPVAIPSGRVERVLQCAHNQWRDLGKTTGWDVQVSMCGSCGAFRYGELILAQVAVTGSSTSAKQVSRESVEHLVEESVMLRSKEYRDAQEQLRQGKRPIHGDACAVCFNMRKILEEQS